MIGLERLERVILAFLSTEPRIGRLHLHVIEQAYDDAVRVIEYVDARRRKEWEARVADERAKADEDRALLAQENAIKNEALP